MDKKLNKILKDYDSTKTKLITKFNLEQDYLCLCINKKNARQSDFILIKKDEEKTFKETINFEVKNIIINQNNQSQIIVIGDKQYIFYLNIIEEPKKKIEENFPLIIDVKFSFFENCYGILYNNGPMNYFKYNYIDSNENIKEIIQINDNKKKYIDFSFCPINNEGFESFIIIFLEENGILKYYGPIFPYEFKLPYDYIINTENFLIEYYNKSFEKKEEENKKFYSINYNMLQDLKKCRVENDNKNYIKFKISKKFEDLNKSAPQREYIFTIKNCFIIDSEQMLQSNNDTRLKKHNKINKNEEENKYKQIYILNQSPITILRVKETDDIDVLIINQEIMGVKNTSLSINQNDDLYNDNFLITRFSISKDRIKIRSSDKLVFYEKRQQRPELYIKTKNELLLCFLPRIEDLRIMIKNPINLYIPNKFENGKLSRLFKWDKLNKYNFIDIYFDYKKEQEFYFINSIKEGEDYITIKYILNLDEQGKNLKEDNINELKKKYQKKFTENIFTLDKLTETKKIIESNIQLDKEENIKEIKHNEQNFENKIKEIFNYLNGAYGEIVNNNIESFNANMKVMTDMCENIDDNENLKNIISLAKRIDYLYETKKKIEKNNDEIKAKIKSILEKIEKYKIDKFKYDQFFQILDEYEKGQIKRLSNIEIEISEEINKINNIFVDKKFFNIENSISLKHINDKNIEKYQNLKDLIYTINELEQKFLKEVKNNKDDNEEKKEGEEDVD